MHVEWSQAGPKSQNLITDNFAWMDFAGTSFDYNALLIIIPAVQLQSQKSLSLSDVIIWKQKWNILFCAHMTAKQNVAFTKKLKPFWIFDKTGPTCL